MGVCFRGSVCGRGCVSVSVSIYRIYAAEDVVHLNGIMSVCVCRREIMYVVVLIFITIPHSDKVISWIASHISCHLISNIIVSLRQDTVISCTV
jgi:hypothetical protein